MLTGPILSATKPLKICRRADRSILSWCHDEMFLTRPTPDKIDPTQSGVARMSEFGAY